MGLVNALISGSAGLQVVLNPGDKSITDLSGNAGLCSMWRSCSNYGGSQGSAGVRGLYRLDLQSRDDNEPPKVGSSEYINQRSVEQFIY